MKPFFSIVLPIYNVEKYLEECLKSIEKQSYSSFEVLCINDGSTDNSLEIASKFSLKDKRFKLFNQKNSGVSVARNRGIKEANGKYILFVDSDDWIEQDTLKKIHEDIQAHDSDIVVFGGDTFPRTKWIDDKLNTKNIIYKDNAIHALLQENGSIPFMCNKAYSKELLEKSDCKFSEELSLGEDQAFQFMIFPYAEKISFIDDKLYHYRQGRQGSAMENFSKDLIKKMEQHVKLCSYIRSQWKNKNLFLSYGSAWANWCINFLYDDIKRLPYNQALEITKKILPWFSSAKNDGLRRLNKQRLDDLKSLVASEGNILISVIMPVYNSAQFLSECIESILNQSFYQFELLCVDDGSSDNSVEILQEYKKKDKRIRVFTQEHLYAGAERNLGMKHAKGKYLLFLDSDDYFDKNLLEKSYDCAERYNSDICVFKARSYDQKTGKISDMPWTCNTTRCPKNQTFSRESNSKYIFAFTTAAPWTKLFRKEFVFSQGLQFQETRSANDLLFVFSALALAKNIIALDEYLVYYRINAGTSLQATQDKKPLAFYDALCALKKELNNKGIYYQLQQSYIVFALDCCLYNLGTLKTKSAFEMTYFFLRNKAFKELDIIGKTKDYFYAYTKNNFEKMQDICNLAILEYVDKYNLFRSERVIFKDRKGLYLNTSIKRSAFTTKMYKAIFCCYEHGAFYTTGLFIKKIKCVLRSFKNKIVGGFNCMLDHGFSYTVKLGIKKIRSFFNKNNVV